MTALPAPNIDFEGLVNARDVGGIATADGRTIRTGVLYRSETPQLMTEADVARALSELAIGRVVDLRAERFGGSGPIGDDGRGVLLDFFEAMGGFESVGMSTDGFLPSLLDRGAVPLAGFFAHFTATDQPVLVHCHTGKDRTGFVVALTLALLGVPDAAIVADYERTQPVFEAMMANLHAIGLGVPDRAPAYAKEPPSTDGVVALLARLHAEWGSPESWAADQGIDAALIDAVRSRLLD